MAFPTHTHTHTLQVPVLPAGGQDGHLCCGAGLSSTVHARDSCSIHSLGLSRSLFVSVDGSLRLELELYDSPLSLSLSLKTHRVDEKTAYVSQSLDP